MLLGVPLIGGKYLQSRSENALHWAANSGFIIYWIHTFLCIINTYVGSEINQICNMVDRDNDEFVVFDGKGYRLVD